MATSRTPAPSRKPSLILVGSLAALLGAPLALSTPLYWLGTTDGSFNADNWTNTTGTAVVSGLIPASNDALHFNTAEASFNNLAGSFTINNNLLNLKGLSLAITDNSATADFNISGNAITIGSAGITSQVLNGTGATLSFGGTGITLEAAASFNAIFGNLTINSLVDNGGNLLTVTGPGDTTINAALSGIGGLHKTGSGALQLAVSNSSSGPIEVSQGTVNATAINALGISADLLVNGGTVAISSFNNLVGAVTLTSGSITGTSGTLGASAFSVESGTISAHLDGSGLISANLTKTTAGTVTLSGTNSLLGGVNVNGGILALASSGALGTTGPIGFGGGVLQFSASNTTDYSARFEFIGAQAYKFDTNGQSVTLATALTSNGGTLVKSGTGTLFLTGANSYTGQTTISAGILLLQNNTGLGTALGNSGSGTTVATGAALQMQGGLIVGAENLTLNGSGIASTGALTNISGNNTYGGAITLASAAQIHSASAGQTLTLKGNINAGAFLLTLTGPGTITMNGILSGTAVSTLTVDGGGTTLNLMGLNTLAAGGSQSTGFGGVISVGGTTSSNTVNVSNGGTVATTANGNRLLVVGGTASSGSNTVNVSTPGTPTAPTFVLVGQQLQALQLGVSSSNNTLNVTNGAYFGSNQTAGNANVSYWLVGSNVGSNSNSLIVNGAGSSFDRVVQAGFNGTNVGAALQIGQQSDGNSVVVSAGGLFRPLRLQIGSASDGSTKAGTNNFLRVTGNGSLASINQGSNSIFDLGNTTGANGNYVAIEAGGAFEYSGTSSGNSTQGLIRNFKIGGLGNNNYLSVTGANSILRVANQNPLVIGGQAFNNGAPTDGGTGNHLDIGNGGWVDLTLANGVAGSTSVYAIGSASNSAAINLGDGNSLSTLKVGASTQNGTLGSVYLKYSTGQLNINNGRLIATANGALIAGAGVVQLNGASFFNTTQAANTVINTIAGGATGTLTKEGTGAITLSGSNTYTAATTIDGGTLNDGNGTAGSLNGTTGTALTFTGTGTFHANQASGVSQGMGALTFSAGAAQVQITNAGTSNLTFTSLAGRSPGATANFVKAGAGPTSIVLGGQSTGVLDQGHFFGGNNYAYYDAGNFVRALVYTDPDAATSGTATSLASVAQQEITGAITAQTSATFTTLKITGASDLTLDPAQTVTLNGLLKSGANSATISGGTGIQAANNAEMVIRVDLAGDGLVINTPILANGSNPLTKDGAGTLTLGAANTSTGTTTINSGTLTYGISDALATGAVTIHNGTLAIGTFTDTVGTVTLREGAITGGLGGTLTSTGGFTLHNHAATSASAILAGAVGLTKNGFGTATLSAANTYSGSTTINYGTLFTGIAGALPTNTPVIMGADPSAILNLNNFSTPLGSLTGGSATGGGITLGTAILTVGGDATSPSAYLGIISGTGGLTKIGAGTLTLSGFNSYTGITKIDGGVLNAALRLTNGSVAGSAFGTNYSSSIGAASNAATNLVFGGGTLKYSGDVTSLTDRLFTIGDAAGDTATLDASGTTALATITYSNPGAVAFGNLNAHTLTLTGTHLGNNLFAPIIGNGTGGTSLVKAGTGKWVISGANPYAGPTGIQAGTLEITGGSAIGNASAVNIATVSGAKLLVSASETIGSLSGGNGASGEVALGANTLTLGDATETTYAGTISGTATTGTLIKVGTGTLNLAASSLLPFDNLTANDGTLNLNAILGTGTGTAVVTVNDTPGGVATKLQLGSVSQTLSSLTIGEGATVVFTSGAATGAFSTASGKAGTFGTEATNFGPSASLVPEPGTIGLLLIGALSTLHRRQRPTGRVN